MNKICVYTCITGNYDDLKEVNKEEGIDYFCFTNNKTISSNSWNVIYIENKELDNQRLSRKLKMLGHPKINNYDILLWMDASVVFNRSIKEFIHTYFNKGDNFVAIKHHSRSCIYDEAVACIEQNKDTKESIRRHINFLEKEKFPHQYGLCEMTVFIKNPKDSAVRKTMKLWFDIVCNYSKRDQLSFMYSIWKTGLKIKVIDLNVWNNDWFIWKKHNSDFNNKYKVYYDYGNGFSEENCDEKTYKSKSNKKNIEVTVPKGCNNIRLDPTDKDFMYIKNLEITENIEFNCFNMEKSGNYYLFLNDDPSIMINVKNIDKVKISYELYENSDDINKKLINLLYIDKVKNEKIIDNLNKLNESIQNELKKVKNDLNNIYNSRSLKITKPIRIITNKLRNIRGVLNEK